MKNRECDGKVSVHHHKAEHSEMPRDLNRASRSNGNRRDMMATPSKVPRQMYTGSESNGTTTAMSKRNPGMPKKLGR